MIALCLKLLFVSFCSFALLAFAFEGYLRYRGFLRAQPAMYPCSVGDPVLNHLFLPSCEAQAVADDLKTTKNVTYRTNPRGFRGPSPRERAKTLLVIGDSYTEGFGLDESETFPAQLEKAVADPGWQVLNGGTLGFSTVLYPAYFDRFFLELRPQWVLLNLDFSDPTDDSYFLQIADYDTLGNPVAFPGREALPAWMMGFIYSNRSALVRFLHQEINQWEGIRRREAAQWQMDRFISQGPALIDELSLQRASLMECRKSLEAVARNILRLRRRVESVGGRLAVHMYLPGQILKKYEGQPQNFSFVQAWDQRNRTDFSWACTVGPSVVEVMRAFAGRQGIPFLDSVSFIMGQADREKLFFDHDAHWNAEGVRRVTAALAPEIVKLLRSGERKH